MKRMSLLSIAAIVCLSASAFVHARHTAAPTTAPTTAPSSTLVDDKSTVTAEGIVAAPIAEIWNTFSTAEGYKALGPAKAEMDFRVGGLISSSYDPTSTLKDEKTIVQEIMSYEPGRMLSIRITKPPKGFPFLEAYKHVWTIITLTDLGANRTNIRLTMCGYGTDDESQQMREFFRTGNQWTLSKLQGKYEAGVALPKAVHADGPLADVVVERLIGAPREDVYKAYTTADGWKQFMGVVARIGTLPGEPFEIEFGAENPVGQRGSEGCKILSTVPGKMFSYSWNAPPAQPFARSHPTWVVVDFESLSENVTRVRIHHLGFDVLAAQHPGHAAEFEKARAYFVEAWPMVMSRLAAKLELK